MKKLITICTVVSMMTIILLAAGQAGATLTAYVNNPHTNSVDWTNAVTAAGGSIENLNFNDISTGPLTLVSTGNYALNAYQASEGVTFAVKGNAPAITNGSGPSGDGGIYQSNTGEGAHPVSNYISFPSVPGFSGGYTTSITMNFDDAVAAVGFFTIGLNNSFTPGITRITIEAFTGVNATGTSLGTATSIDAHNFNYANLYFMGLTSNANDIMSFRISGAWQRALGDNVGFDDFRFASVPEPATISILCLGALSLIRRKK